MQLLNCCCTIPQAGTSVQGPFQPSALAPGLQHTLVLGCPSLSWNDAEE